jgi:hypothetical protein
MVNFGLRDRAHHFVRLGGGGIFTRLKLQWIGSHGSPPL